MQFTVHHIALSVSNLTNSIGFYRRLGFEPVMEWQADDCSLSIAHLKNGSMLLELFCYAHSQAAPESALDLKTDLPRLGCKHVGLRTENIEAALQSLHALGLVDEGTINEGRTGIRYFFIRDPDGIFVEIVEDRRDFR